MGGESSWQEPTEKICRPEELMRHTQVSWGQADQQLARSIDYDKLGDLFLYVGVHLLNPRQALADAIAIMTWKKWPRPELRPGPFQQFPASYGPGSLSQWPALGWR
ncbi:hypothetical protein PC119_g2945 [Phytophthora cactorum]|uniref:Uncharacterized protein n=1 Tax=Phytophthora cactorum TaxID=29920 RepID=A0A8T1A0S5_9STRA|nr:hypothetical protein PC112_g1736 [Phytophthora cactorum]KAG2868038.1 hypothetical protein PC113_g1399 [Phytophthora cactorum]KAG3038357.1 hypothetical protein PC119_g2945 [Phytophthora cactorum]